MKWKPATADAFTFDGNKATCVAPDPGRDHTINLMVDEVVPSGRSYWIATFLKANSSSFGVTTPDKFKEDYYMTGMFYNGNLTDHSGSMCGFGPRPANGDRLGMLLDVGQGLKIYYFMNDKPLGLAFDIPTRPAELKVAFSGKAGYEVTLEKSDTIPPVPAPGAPTGLNGDFKCIPSSYKENGMAGTLPPTADNSWTPDAITLAMTSDADKIVCHAKVVNLMNITLKKEGDGYKGGPFPSTMMAGDPRMMECEVKLSDLFSTVTNVVLQGEDTVVFTAPTKSCSFVRYNKGTPAPITEVPKFLK